MSQGITDDIKSAVRDAIDGAVVEVKAGGGGHFEIDVTAAAFDGKSLLQKQRMVLQAIKHLMAGDNAPVHAVDKIHTRLP